jgi:hypothetical protein
MELRRDVSQDLDDPFEILTDSNHHRRDAYVFEVNPLGTQNDGLIVEEQGDTLGGDHVSIGRGYYLTRPQRNLYQKSLGNGLWAGLRLAC